jgi:hypothetical protein
MVLEYTCTRHHVWYHGTMVDVYHTYHGTYSTMVRQYSTIVHVYVRTYVRVRTYVQIFLHYLKNEMQHHPVWPYSSY